MATSRAGKALFESLLTGRPHTYKTLQALVMAAADCVNHQGKRSLFGRDKGSAAQRKFMHNLEAMPNAMQADRLISSGTSYQMYLAELERWIGVFEAAYPSWPEAYALIHAVLDTEKGQATEVA